MAVVSNTTSVSIVSNAGPSWAQSLSLNTWTALSNTNTFQSQWPANTGFYGISGPAAVYTAWNGAAYCSGYGTYGSMIHWGGGHTDYYGNEVYRMDLDTLTWSRIKDPYASATGGTATNGIWPDGTPAAAHTYYYIAGLPTSLVICKRQINNTPTSAYNISRFDLPTLTWYNNTNDHSLNAQNDEGICYDSTRDVYWLVASVQGLNWSKFTPGSGSAGSWTNYTEPTGAYNQGCGPVYVPSKDCVVGLFESTSVGLDPASPTTDKVILTSTGTRPSMSGGSARWSSNLGAIVFYPSRSSQIYLFTPPSGDWRTGTWTWSQRSVTGSTGTHSGTPGTYGKFQIAEWGSTTVGILHADVAGATRAIKLS